MRLDDLRPSDNVEDRRGGGSGGFGGGGFGGRPLLVRGGGLGLVGIVVVAMLFGVDPGQLLNGLSGLPVAEQGAGQSTGQSTGGGIEDADRDFARRMVGSAEDVWTPILARHDVRYESPILTLYDEATPTGCGTGQAAMGPFYCPADRRVYIDTSFYGELANRFGAPGRFAQAYVVAHEIGHHIQNLTGTSDRVSAMMRAQGGGEGAQGPSVRLELQADCYAGVWTKNADAQSRILEPGDIESGLRAASAVGDDTLQKQARGRVMPDSFTHGSSEQRVRWFTRGYETGDMDRCDTFSARTL